MPKHKKIENNKENWLTILHEIKINNAKYLKLIRPPNELLNNTKIRFQHRINK